MYIIKESKEKDYFVDFIKKQINIDLSDRISDSKNRGLINLDIVDIDKMKVIECQPYTRLSFASSGITHAVLPSNNKLFWIFFDMRIEDEPPFTNVDASVVKDLNDKRLDFINLLSLKNKNGDYALKQMFMSDFNYLMTSRVYPKSCDYVPPYLD